MTDDLQAMFRYLDTLTGRPDLPVSSKNCRASTIDLDDLSEYVHFAENGYKRNLVRCRAQLSRLGVVLEERPAFADPRPQRLGVRGARAARHADRDAVRDRRRTATSRRHSRATSPRAV